MREMPSRISNGMFFFTPLNPVPNGFTAFSLRKHTAARALVRLTHYNILYYHYYNIIRLLFCVCARIFFNNMIIFTMYDD